MVGTPKMALLLFQQQDSSLSMGQSIRNDVPAPQSDRVGCRIEQCHSVSAHR
ncbi:hypothetical protein [Leptolyngbya sp. CCY15150]|uniref:hypothetical protein n=1 Tax=Leptolyngbya sp. CCY15150 TaxID=2767772 RepID=UPI00194E2A6F|nr:hypothetical protein [Leptolyngbya sp. CCY15150]